VVEGVVIVALFFELGGEKNLRELSDRKGLLFPRALRDAIMSNLISTLRESAS